MNTMLLRQRARGPFVSIEAGEHRARGMIERKRKRLRLDKHGGRLSTED
jgi:hypothetical protein